MAVDLNRLEIERLDNLTRNFGWSKTKEELTDTKIILTIEKPRVAMATELGEGAD